MMCIPYNISWINAAGCRSFSTGGSHSLMTVLSEHLDLFTPLAGSRLIGRETSKSFFVWRFLSFSNAFFKLKPFLNLTTGVSVYICMYRCTYTYMYIYIYIYIHSIVYNIYKAQCLPLAFDFFSTDSTYSSFGQMPSFRCLGRKTAQLPFLGLAIRWGFSSSPSLSNSLEGLKDVC